MQGMEVIQQWKMVLLLEVVVVVVVSQGTPGLLLLLSSIFTEIAQVLSLCQGPFKEIGKGSL